MEILRIETWKQFSSRADDFDMAPLHLPQWAFRGMADSTWPLTHTLLRCSTLPGEKVPVATAVRIFEEYALKAFQTQAHLFLPASALQHARSTIGWWTLMQHYGAPTRLLDWTQSPYVAAYFAVTSEPAKDGAIYLFNVLRLIDEVEKKYGRSVDLSKDETLLSERLKTIDAPRNLGPIANVYKTDRMVAQQGFFTISEHVLAAHDEVLSELLGDDKNAFQKWVIPAKSKLEFLKKLPGMNITASSLFPGMDGIGRTVREAVQLAAIKQSIF